MVDLWSAPPPSVPTLFHSKALPTRWRAPTVSYLRSAGDVIKATGLDVGIVENYLGCEKLFVDRGAAAHAAESSKPSRSVTRWRRRRTARLPGNRGSDMADSKARRPREIKAEQKSE